jgi:hypothetical protein
LLIYGSINNHKNIVIEFSKKTEIGE